MKYLDVNYLNNDLEYTFFNSENIPQYLFISVIVALFIGLTTSAEEIIGNLKILQREKFLNLSKGSYLFSKIGIMFMISAIQTLFYILVGNSVLEIKGMFLSHWLILFSTSCFANLLGLNISSSFNSVKVIYILIPICIIPQLLFSGIIVPFDKLHPYFSSKSEVPIIGNVMASRWAYEAMAVTQFKDNEFEKLIYDDKKNMSFANWKKDQWESTLETKISSFYRNHSLENQDELTAKKVKRDGKIVVNEIRKELIYFPESSNMDKNKVEELLSKVEANNLNKEEYASLISYLSSTRNYYKALYKDAENHHESTIGELLEINNTTRENLRELKSEKKISSRDYRKYKRFITKLKNVEFQSFKTKYNNQSLEDVVTNSNTLKFIDEDENSLIQKSDPIFLDPYTFRFLGAQFYSPTKYLGSIKLDTLYANIMVIWLMTILLVISLYYDLLRKLLEGSGLIVKILKNRFANK